MEQVIETSVWQKSQDGSGHLERIRTKTVWEVLDEIRAVVGEYPDGCDEYLNAAEEGSWPEGRIAVFSVTGESEGDYIHVEVLNGPKRTPVILGKTFDGRDAAWRFARRLADLLGV